MRRESGAAPERPGLMQKVALIGATAALAIVAACGVVPSTSRPQEPVTLYDGATRHRADQVVSTHENGTQEIQYDYVEYLDDGRGYTAGRGLTTGTGDALKAVKKLKERKPDSPLVAFIPALEAVNGTDSIDGLDGFSDAWQAEARDEDNEFKKAQDEVVDEDSFEPAMDAARQYDIKTAVGQLILYDTVVQHGPGDDPDSLYAILENADERTPRETVSEREFLDVVLEERLEVLENPADGATAEEWRESTDRVETSLQGILDSGNVNLTAPLIWKFEGTVHTAY